MSNSNAAATPTTPSPASLRPRLRLLRKAFARAWLLSPSVLRNQWGILLLLQGLDFSVSQIFLQLETLVLQQGAANLGGLIGLAFVQMIYGLVWSAFWLLIVSVEADAQLYNTPSRPWVALVARYLNQILIETVRSLARVLLWLPALLVPALVKYIRLSFVPFVVIFDPVYDRGQADALARSEATIKGTFWRASFAVLFSISLAPLLALLVHGGNSSLIENPLGAVAAQILTLFSNVYAGIFLYSVYDSLSIVKGLRPDPTFGDEDIFP